MLDADIRRFYDTLDHGWLVKFVEHRVADRRVVRLIQKWLKAGVLEEGQRIQSEVGTVQGGSISPLLANLYLHYVFDLWTQRWRKKQAHGDVIVVRFADDFVVGFEHRARGRALPDGTARALREVRAGAAPRQDEDHRVRPLCGTRSAKPWRRQTGDLQLPRLHAQLRKDPEGHVYGAAADDAPEVASQAAGTESSNCGNACTRPSRNRGLTCARSCWGTSATTECP